MSNLDSNWMGERVSGDSIVEFEANRQNAPFDNYIAILFDGVKEETLDPALMEHDLVKPAKTRNIVYQSVRTLNYTVLVQIP